MSSSMTHPRAMHRSSPMSTTIPSTSCFQATAWSMCAIPSKPYPTGFAIKRGGHLVISVPDEDLYEQGVWPSTFNTDHKITFTLSKKTSWSPVSVNVFSLLSQFSDQV